MKVTITQATSWERALNAARLTAGKAPIHKEPSDVWKRAMLLAEHSPIRLVEYDILIEDVPTWVINHFTRHHVGCEKFVRTQRADRNESVTNRNALPQGTLNSFMITANAQAIMNISRVRLCSKASAETRLVWQRVVRELAKIDHVLASVCVPTCVARGFCPETNGCGKVNSCAYNREIMQYRGISASEKYINLD